MPSAVRLTLQVTELESGETATAQNIALGEVWLASGQSNMEFKVSSLADGGAELRRRADAGELDAVRMLTVPRNALLTPARDVDAAWQTASAATIDDWSAVALFFAKKLADELAVPVGVLASSWGGTIAEAWTSGETLARNPDIARAYSEYLLRTGSTEYWDSLSPEELEIPMRNFETALFTHLPPEPENNGFSAGWAESAYDDSNWDRTALPAQWKEFDLNTNGTVWFRRKVEIPAEWAGRELILTLGAVDKHDITYFDGVEVGRTGSGYDTSCWDVCRVYRIPSELVRPGLRVIAVRDYSFAYDGGLTGPASGMKLAPADAEREKISIAGEWSYKIETDLGPAFPHLSGMGLCCPNSFSILFDNMIRPLVPAALRGVIWYQGESNAIRFHQYERLMRDLIADWRFHFAQGDIPFLQVLLAGYRTAMDYDPNSEWAPIREAQSRAGRRDRKPRRLGGRRRRCRRHPPEGQADRRGTPRRRRPHAGIRRQRGGFRAGIPLPDPFRRCAAPLLRPCGRRAHRAGRQAARLLDRRKRPGFQTGRSRDRRSQGRRFKSAGSGAGRRALRLERQPPVGRSAQQRRTAGAAVSNRQI